MAIACVLCCAYHIVFGVSGFLSCRPNWDPPVPSPARESCPSLSGPRGGTHSSAGEGVGGAKFQLRDRHSGTLSILYCNPSSAHTDYRTVNIHVVYMVLVMIKDGERGEAI